MARKWGGYPRKKFPSIKKWLARKFRKKPIFEERVFPSTEFPILEREKFKVGWNLLKHASGTGIMSKEKLRQVLDEWGERGDVSRADARRLLELWGIPEETIERVVSTYPYPK